MRKVFIISIVVIVVLLSSNIGISYSNAEILDSVSIKLLPEGKEVLDPVVLGIGKGQELPDYRVKVKAGFFQTDLGTRMNVSAREWLEFPAQGKVIPFSKLQSIDISDADNIKDDLLDRVLVTGYACKGTTFECILKTHHSFEKGFKLFMSTQMGLIVTIAIGLALCSAIVAGIRLAIMSKTTAR